MRLHPADEAFLTLYARLDPNDKDAVRQAYRESHGLSESISDRSVAVRATNLIRSAAGQQSLACEGSRVNAQAAEAGVKMTQAAFDNAAKGAEVLNKILFQIEKVIDGAEPEDLARLGKLCAEVSKLQNSDRVPTAADAKALEAAIQEQGGEMEFPAIGTA